MGILRPANRFHILGQALIFVGALWFVGCDRGTGASSPSAAQIESVQQKQAHSAPLAPATAVASPSPSTPANDGLDEFKQALGRKFDRSRWHERPASPQGGILHKPNGQAVHAAILVKNPDGTISKECVSSAAEVSALVDEIRGGRTP